MADAMVGVGAAGRHDAALPVEARGYRPVAIMSDAARVMQKLQSEAGSRHDADQGAEGIGLVRSQLLSLAACSNMLAIRTCIRSNTSKYHGTCSKPNSPAMVTAWSPSN